MESRQLGRTGRQVSVVGLGCWQLGADWGDVGEDDALAVLHAARRCRGDVPRHRRRLRRRPQRDTRRPGAARARRRRASRWRPRWAGAPTRTCPEAFTLEAFRGWLDRSRAQPRRRHDRPGPAALPADAGLLRRPGLRRPRRLVDEQVIARLRRLRRDRRRGAHRDRPAARRHRADHPQRVPAQAARAGAARGPAAGVGIIARVPLACGLLSGKYDETHDLRRRRPPHLQPRRRGVRRRRDVQRGPVRGRCPGRPRAGRALTPHGATTAQLALRWLVDQPGVSTVIPGARNAEQARANAAAADLAALDAATLGALRERLRRPRPRPRARPLVGHGASTTYGRRARHLARRSA